MTINDDSTDRSGATRASEAGGAGSDETTAAGARRDQSLGELLGDLSQQTSTLVRQEIALAQAEMTQKARAAGKGAGLFGAGAVLGLALLGAFTAFLILLIALWIPTWLAAAAVTVLYALVVGALALAGRSQVRRATPATPEQTIETVKEDAAWAKTQARSAKK